MTSAVTAMPPTARPRAAHRGYGKLLIALGLLALLVQAILIGARAWREYVPHYPPDARADRTLVTPVALSVVDPEATARAREQEGRRMPPLYRFDPRVGDLAAERFLSDYDRRHALFLQGLRRKWPDPLVVDDLASPQFTDYVTAFRLAHPDFPLPDPLAQDWAGETTLHPFRNRSASALRDTLRQYVVGDDSPRHPDANAEVFVSPPGDVGGVTDPAKVETSASRLSWRVMIPVGKVRDQLRGELRADGSEWANFVAGFALPNVTLDTSFTAAARHEFTKDVTVRTEFQAGAPLITSAQPITAVQQAALGQLRNHYDVRFQERGWAQWWLGGFGLLLLSAGTAANQWPRSIRPPGSIPELTRLPPAAAGDPQLAAVRSGLIQQLGHWLKLELVQRLIQQRHDAVAAQRAAASHVEVLNDRLTKLHPEIRERVAEYERRIAQLERELDGANEVSCELIKTKISLARKELEIEKAKSNLVWN